MSINIREYLNISFSFGVGMILVLLSRKQVAPIVYYLAESYCARARI